MSEKLLHVSFVKLMSQLQKEILKSYSERLNAFKKELEEIECDVRLYAVKSGIRKINLANVCPVCGPQQKVDR
ncbi:uncharacterized protein LOC142324412 isoform X2 [Lycorma delicatula]|uniref:uncharacterized protein LOC142324412 isoform X2 n=1 Tax=Lycorma delicatula TaxID=130591 RepID=UPI003F5139EA